MNSHPSTNKVPLVLLAGWGVNSQVWRPLVPLLSDTFELHLLDLPGYGHDPDYRGSYSLSAIVNRVLEAAPQSAVWVGWSLGATIAMQAAILHPERFSGLQIISGTPRFMAAPDWEWGMHVEPLNQLMDSFELNYETGLKKFLLLQTQQRPLVREQLSSILSLPGPSWSTLQHSLRLLIETDLRTTVHGIRVPTRILAGVHDRVVSATASRWLAEQIVAADHQCKLTAGGHLGFLESPAALVKDLQQFAQVIAE